MTKTTISHGQPVPAAFFNAVNNPQFTVDEAGEEFDGIHKRIRDDGLSNDATQIKTRVNNHLNALQVTAGSGLNLNYTAGTVQLPTGAVQSIAAGTIVAPNNVTSTVYVDTTGTVSISTSPPVIRLDLATVVTSGGSISSVSDLRARFRVLPRANALQTFGGQGTTDYTVTGSETWSLGQYIFRNLTISSSGILTIDKYAKIRVSGNLVIQGTVNVSACLLGGVVQIETTPGVANNSNQGSGLAPGRLSTASGTYNYLASRIGSSGGSGGTRLLSSGSGTVNPSFGGDGGGGVDFEVAGTVTVNNATIQANGGNATAPSLAGGTTNAQSSGGGGGSGGYIAIRSINSIAITSSTINARGGNGATGVSANSLGVGGGGGGGGGWIVLQAPSVSVTTSTVSVAGGTGGGGVGTTGWGGGSGGGFAGSGGNSVGGGTAGAGSTGQYLAQNVMPSID